MTYRSAVASDALTLPPVARAIFVETFAPQFDAEVLAVFCDSAYGESGSMATDFRDPAIQWCIAEHEGQPIGYAKLRPLVAPAEQAAPGAMELQQIYVQSQWQGHGVAPALMQWAETQARQRGATELYLTVFDHNQRAKRFYGKYGFSEVGHCLFEMGGQFHEDRIWRKLL